MGCCCSQDSYDDDEEEGKLEYLGGNVHIVSSKFDWELKSSEANNDGKIIVLNFSASWCGPCRLIERFYVEMSKKYSSMCFLSVDVDELTEFTSSWEIRATPTFYFLKNGEETDKLVGANKLEFEKALIRHAESL